MAVRDPVKDRKGSVLSKVHMTPNATCAHATKECKTLCVSPDFVDRRLCTVCCKIKRFPTGSLESGRGSANPDSHVQARDGNFLEGLRESNARMLHLKAIFCAQKSFASLRRLAASYHRPGHCKPKAECAIL